MTTLRQRLFAALFCLIVVEQVLALLDGVGVRWPDPFVVVVLGNSLAPALGALFGRWAPEADRDTTRTVWWGFAAWAVWAGLYYLVAWASASRAFVLPAFWTTRAETMLPLVPATVLVYMNVHPLSALPFFGLRSATAIRRHTAGHLIIVAVSVVCWTLLPMMFPRAALPASQGSLGLWVLSSLRESDPATNCLPSTHCAMAVYAAIALRTVDVWLGRWATLTAAVITVSTLLTRQHYLIDALAGVTLGYAVGRRAHG